MWDEGTAPISRGHPPMGVRTMLQAFPQSPHNQSSSSYPQFDLSVDEAISAFINADGNLNLCAERTGCDRADIVSALSQDIPRLQQQLRTLSIINLCHESNIVRQRVRQTAGALDAEPAMRAYLGLQQLL